jgi:dienelactone hydrolase
MQFDLLRRSFLLQGAALPIAGAQAQGKVQNISEGPVSGVFVTPARVPAPCIFVLHTAEGKIQQADISYAEALAAAGFAAFAINYSGWGHPTYVREYITWAEKRPEVAHQPLGAVGFSMGGHCAFYFALSPRIKAVVSYYGTYDLQTTPVAEMRTNNLKASPINLVDEMHCAALLLHGERDNEVPLEQVERMKRAMQARGLPCESVVYPGAYHDFDRGPLSDGDRTGHGTILKYDGAAAKDAEARSIAWFRKYLV